LCADGKYPQKNKGTISEAQRRQKQRKGKKSGLLGPNASMYAVLQRNAERQIDKQTKRYTDRQTDKDPQTHRSTDRHTDRQAKVG